MMYDEEILYYLLENNITQHEYEFYDDYDEVNKLYKYNLLDDDHMQVQVYVDDVCVDEYEFGIGG